MVSTVICRDAKASGGGGRDLDRIRESGEGFSRWESGTGKLEQENRARGICEDTAEAFLHRGEVQVGEDVAHEASACHAEGLETIARLPMAEGEWHLNLVGVEDLVIGREVGAGKENLLRKCIWQQVARLGIE